MTENSNTFEYTYSAKEQAEIRKIREKYIPKEKEESNIERLRRLDASVTKTAQIVSLILGVAGSLILGFGMSLFMSDLHTALGVGGDSAVVIGVIIGIVGAFVLILAYPAYNTIVKNKREKLAPEIIRLTDELMK